MEIAETINIERVCKLFSANRYNIYKHYTTLEKLHHLSLAISNDIKNKTIKKSNHEDIPEYFRVLKLAGILTNANFKSKTAYNHNDMPDYMRNIIMSYDNELKQILKLN